MLYAKLCICVESHDFSGTNLHIICIWPDESLYRAGFNDSSQPVLWGMRSEERYRAWFAAFGMQKISCAAVSLCVDMLVQGCPADSLWATCSPQGLKWRSQAPTWPPLPSQLQLKQLQAPPSCSFLFLPFPLPCWGRVMQWGGGSPKPGVPKWHGAVRRATVAGVLLCSRVHLGIWCSETVW